MQRECCDEKAKLRITRGFSVFRRILIVPRKNIYLGVNYWVQPLQGNLDSRLAGGSTRGTDDFHEKHPFKWCVALQKIALELLREQDRLRFCECACSRDA
jgi:hypothetical protein